MNTFPEIPEEYILRYAGAENELLHEIYRFSNAQLLYGQMVSGHLQGRLLSMLSHMIRPRRILEIGTFTGYSALCLAEGLGPEGRLDTIEVNDEMAEIAAGFFRRSPMEPQIRLHVGDALELIPKFEDTYDLVFIDGAKNQYASYYDVVYPVTKTPGYILADNVLWYGKASGSETGTDPATTAIRNFNDKIASDKRVQQIILPIRDGLMVVRK